MKPKHLFSIGEASQITGAHVKSLRYYDRIGVFAPDYVDEKTGYRYYSFEQLQKIVAVRTCLATDIVLNDLEKYVKDDEIDYSGLLDAAKASIEEQISVLQKTNKYLDFIKNEIEFNERKDADNRTDECYGSVALWTMPFDGDIEEFDRKACYIRLAAEAKKKGYQINPLYFGMLMRRTAGEKQLYAIAGIEDFLDVDDDGENIFRTPAGWYRREYAPDLDVTRAEEMFPDLFAMDYDIVALSTVSLSGSEEPFYSIFINLPEEK